MQLNLSIANDVVGAVRDLARRQRKSVGELLSALARRALNSELPNSSGHDDGQPVHGFRAFPGRGGVVTNELIDRLRKHEG